MSSTTKTHQAAILYGAKDLKLRAIDTPDLKPHEVQIKPRATGICGTDQHYYQNGRNGIYTVEEPLILGHEAAGEIVAVGSGVDNLKIGDRVAVEPQLACSVCKQCRSGRYNLCPLMRFNGSASAKPPPQGSLQKLWNHPAYLCYNLPDSVSYIEGCMAEPLSVALHSVRKAVIDAGETIVITGAGAIGLLCARIARISGACSVLMIDVDQARLDFAKQQKLADMTYKMPFSAAEDESPAEFGTRMGKQVLSSLSAERAGVLLECTGVESCVNVCIAMAAPGARMVLVGMGRPLQQVNLGQAMVREVQIIPVWRYTNTFQAAIDLIESGMVDVKSLVSHTFDIKNVVEALEFTLSRPADLIKCVITSEI